ncbi:hypothetical protein [Kiloniella laminariae]|uniref:hypothetical protein n=1 Tax=Kiloniella laminariae TaxID=454162 RepID=UPI0003661FEB|nr:hypothetical protein [Kiloniella laminariae]
MKAKIVLFLMLVFSSGPALSQTEDQWLEDRGKIRTYLQEGDCSGFWNIVWPWVERDHRDAQSLLWAAMYEFGLVPPGDTPRESHMFTLALHAMSLEDKLSDADIDSVFSSVPVEKVSNLIALKNCVKKGHLIKACFDKAEESGLVPNFTSYVKDINVAIESGKTVVCPYPINLNN